jgi:NB-ARC domain
VQDRCRLILLYGTGGIGKTWLMSQLARQVAPNFEGGSWQHLEGSPTLQEVLTRSQRSLPGLPGQPPIISSSLESQIDWIVQFLRERRYLLIFDGIQEDLLHDQTKWPDYLRLFRRLEAVELKGCVVVTSREKFPDLRQLDMNQGKVRSLKLYGLEAPAAEQLLTGYGLDDRDRWRELISTYSGNPLYLKSGAAMIQEHHNGQVSQFLSLNTVYLGDYESILQAAWNFLKEEEKVVLKRLAEASHPITRQVVQHDLSEYRNLSLSHVLNRLNNKCLIKMDKSSDPFSYCLSPDVRKFVSRQMSS